MGSTERTPASRWWGGGAGRGFCAGVTDGTDGVGSPCCGRLEEEEEVVGLAARGVEPCEHGEEDEL